MARIVPSKPEHFAHVQAWIKNGWDNATDVEKENADELCFILQHNARSNPGAYQDLGSIIGHLFLTKRLCLS